MVASRISMRLVCAPLLAYLLLTVAMPLPEPAGQVAPAVETLTLGDLLPRSSRPEQSDGQAAMLKALRSDLERGTDLERTGSVENKAAAAKAYLATSHNLLDRDRKDTYGDAFHYMWFKKHDPMDHFAIWGEDVNQAWPGSEGKRAKARPVPGATVPRQRAGSARELINRAFMVRAAAAPRPAARFPRLRRPRRPEPIAT